MGVLWLQLPKEDGQTPLHEAAEGGHKEVVQLLLSLGANPQLVDKVRYPTTQCTVHGLPCGISVHRSLRRILRGKPHLEYMGKFVYWILDMPSGLFWWPNYQSPVPP
jgi:hypothetical protein